MAVLFVGLPLAELRDLSSYQPLRRHRYASLRARPQP